MTNPLPPTDGMSRTRRVQLVNLHSWLVEQSQDAGPHDNQMLMLAATLVNEALNAQPHEPAAEHDPKDALARGLANIIAMACDHIDMEALKVSHVKDWSKLQAFVRYPAPTKTPEHVIDHAGDCKPWCPACRASLNTATKDEQS